MSYLTENVLFEILETSDYTFVHNKAFPGSRFRPDFRCDELKLIIEFDGHFHYSQTRTQYRDRDKERLFEEAGYSLIRVPYFIQLTEEVYDRLFINEGFDLNIDRSLLIVSYPHGFVDKKALRPIDFNLIGWNRFLEEMGNTFRAEQYDVFETCIDDMNMVCDWIPENLTKTLCSWSLSGGDTNGMLKYFYESKSD